MAFGSNNGDATYFVSCVNPCASMAFRKTQFRRVLIRWYRKNGRNLPWRNTSDPYAILVSEFMLQQTQVATVLSYYNGWLRRFPNFATLARATENDVLHAWQGLGYYARARNLQATAKTIVDRHGGRFPKSIEQMRELPGIGKYTAHAVASFAFDQSVPIVEANTARVLARIFNLQTPIDKTAGREILWNRATQLVPKRAATRFNSALVDLGALICLPRKPRCWICPVRKFCRAKNPETLPRKKMRPPTTQLTESHAFIVQPNRILLQQANHRWHGMWILPRLQRKSANRHPVYKSIFPFTHHHVTFNVYADRPRKIDKRSQCWIRINSLDSIPMPSPHRRAIAALLSQRSSVTNQALDVEC
jgi:A/G-specific adenine glycosylase